MSYRSQTDTERVLRNDLQMLYEQMYLHEHEQDRGLIEEIGERHQLKKVWRSTLVRKY